MRDRITVGVDNYGEWLSQSIVIFDVERVKRIDLHNFVDCEWRYHIWLFCE